jgi:hypothetical protein
MKKKNIVIASVAVIVLAIAAILIFPMDILKLNTASDLQTVKNFDTIQQKIIEYFKENKKLPEKLEDVSSLPANYEYQVQSDTNFKLCADFKENVSQEIIDKAPIRVDYQKGNSCVVFNIASEVQSDDTPSVIKKDAKLVKQDKTLSTEPSTGVSAGSINIKFDTSKSYFYKNDSDGNYFLNLFTTIGTDKTCTSTLNPEKGCCYSLNELSLSATGDKFAQFNRLGSQDYINPFPTGSEDTYGDLPINFCFQGNKEFSGGISFTIPKEMINSTSTELQFKHTNNGETSGSMKITIK